MQIRFFCGVFRLCTDHLLEKKFNVVYTNQNSIMKRVFAMNFQLAPPNDIPQITGRVVEIEDDVLAVSSQLKEVDYESLFATLDSTLGNIHRISAALNESQGTLGLLLNDSALYNNLNSTCQEANKLLEDLREHPKRYVHFSVFGRKDK